MREQPSAGLGPVAIHPTHSGGGPRIVDYSSSAVANSSSRAFRKSHKKKVPTNLYEYALGGTPTRETDLYQLEDNLIRHRGDLLDIV